jgi:HD-GYP domain-containing protein (c-di-GMP phosphodiesterase class II)
MVRISDILRDDTLSKKKKGYATGKGEKKGVTISEVLTADDILYEKISPHLRAPTKREREDAKNLIETFRGALDNVFSDIRKGKKVKISPLRQPTQKFIRSLDRFQNIYMMHAYDEYDSKDLAPHSLWTALFSVKIGKKLNMDEPALTKLALAGLLHDVGIMKIPEEILHKEGTLFRSEAETMRTHPELGHKIIAEAGEPYRFIADVCYQEHERIDGSGYPRGSKGDEISLYAQIVGLADTYEAMTHRRAYRERKLPIVVIKEIIETMKEKFDLKILRALLEAITLFPVGCYVKLNNQEIGKVIADIGGSHFRHVVQILYGPDGDKLFQPRTINLMETGLLHITEPIDERELSEGE